QLHIPFHGRLSLRERVFRFPEGVPFAERKATMRSPCHLVIFTPEVSEPWSSRAASPIRTARSRKGRSRFEIVHRKSMQVVSPIVKDQPDQYPSLARPPSQPTRSREALHARILHFSPASRSRSSTPRSAAGPGG